MRTLKVLAIVALVGTHAVIAQEPRFAPSAHGPSVVLPSAAAASSAPIQVTVASGQLLQQYSECMDCESYVEEYIPNYWKGHVFIWPGSINWCDEDPGGIYGEWYDEQIACVFCYEYDFDCVWGVDPDVKHYDDVAISMGGLQDFMEEMGCGANYCGISRTAPVDAIDDLIASEDVHALAELIESFEGKLIVNVERGAIQGIGCTGRTDLHIPLGASFLALYRVKFQQVNPEQGVH